MSSDEIAVVVVGVALIALVAWFFWGPRREGTPATLTPSGVQTATILVKGGYTPGTILVEAGKPVRLEFRREETAGCSDRVLFPDFGRSADLPEGTVVPIELPPPAPGEYGFECGMGMLHGKVVAR